MCTARTTDAVLPSGLDFSTGPSTYSPFVVGGEGGAGTVALRAGFGGGVGCLSLNSEGGRTSRLDLRKDSRCPVARGWFTKRVGLFDKYSEPLD